MRLPYELIVTSASRPHLLEQTLLTLAEMMDQLPRLVTVHDDAVFPGKEAEVRLTAERHFPGSRIVCHDPPIGLGPALYQLIRDVRTDYVLYSQDDFETIRGLPIRLALEVMEQHGINQIRFNKRRTMDRKGDFVKCERFFRTTRRLEGGETIAESLPLTVADHWYFQTGLWRTSTIWAVLDWWKGWGPGIFAEHAEAKINAALNGEMAREGFPSRYFPVEVMPPAHWNDPKLRAEIAKTFIWGRIGDAPFISHIGTNPEDWALKRRRDN